MIFLIATVATSVTGFLFHSTSFEPPTSFGPPHVIGVISFVVVAVALMALNGKYLTGHWRAIYVVAAVLALYLNVFVGVVQAFQKLPFLHSQPEAPFLVAQSIVLAVFVIVGSVAAKRFRPL